MEPGIQFSKLGRLFICSKQQSDFEELFGTKVASEATLYLKSEPARLYNFVAELKSLNAKEREDACLEGI